MFTYSPGWENSLTWSKQKEKKRPIWIVQSLWYILRGEENLLPVSSLARIPLIRPGTWGWIRVIIVRRLLIAVEHRHRIVMSLHWNRRGLDSSVVIRKLHRAFRECGRWHTIRRLFMQQTHLRIVQLRVYILRRYLPLGIVANHRHGLEDNSMNLAVQRRERMGLTLL